MNEFIKLYNQIEEKEFNKIPFNERTLFIPHFLKDYNVGKINCEEELCFNVEREHQGRAKKIINILCNNFNEKELENIKFINNKISSNQSSWHYKVVPSSSLFMHIYQQRLINKFFPNAKNILEIGPGCGYLSVLLASEGRTIFSTDIYQPHYIFQNYIYKTCSNLNELTKETKFKLEKDYINHIPWWKFKNLKGNEFQVDLVIMNHMIAEMNPNSLKRLLNFLVNLKNVSHPPIFCESTGATIYNSWDDTTKVLESFNYKKEFSGGSNKETAKTYIFKKNNSKIRNNNNNSNNIIKRILNILPFQREIIKFLKYIQAEIVQFILKITLIKRQQSNLKSFLFFNSKSKFNYDEIMQVYDKNNWNRESLDEQFSKKLSPNNKTTMIRNF